MAAHVVSWGENDPNISPVPSSAPSIVSVDSIVITDKHDISQGLQEAPRATKFWANRVSATISATSVSTYPGADAADDSFTRHHKYFFKDGNVTFLVDGTLYCVHRYFFSRDSVYFSIRFAQLDIRDHEALPTIISLGNIKREDFDAFLSVLYPENFEENNLSYEEWRSVLHFSTRWGFASIRNLALKAIDPPTPHDRLLLARTYSVADWVVPALSALCERTAPLTLSEAGQMSIEDVVLVATVREDIRNSALVVHAAEIPRHVEVAQAGKSVRVQAVKVPPPIPPADPTGGAVEQAPSRVDLKRATKEGDIRVCGERAKMEEGLGDISMQPRSSPKREAKVEVTARRETYEAAAKWDVSHVTAEAALSDNEVTKCVATEDTIAKKGKTRDRIEVKPAEMRDHKKQRNAKLK